MSLKCTRRPAVLARLLAPGLLLAGLSPASTRALPGRVPGRVPGPSETGILAPAGTAETAAAGRPPELFEAVASALRRSFYDRSFRSQRLPGLEREFRPLAEASSTAEEEREVVHRFLSRIPASHLALYSRPTHARLFAELACEARPTLGFQLTRLADDYFVDWVLEGGPAERWGLRRGDRVLEIDGQSPAVSRRLDWRSDDASLPDPPLHALLCDAGDEVALLVERSPGVTSRGVVVAEAYSGCDAARASARVFLGEGARVGYVHLWFIAAPGAGDLIEELVQGHFANCDGLVLDLRGRGGSASEVGRLTRLLARDGPYGKPVVLLTDKGTRSAKEVIAYEMQRAGDALVVGERSAGAVIPASFQRVGADGVLMFPEMTLGRFTQALEGRGVEPDIRIDDQLPFAAGADPILEAGIVALEVWLEER